MDTIRTSYGTLNGVTDVKTYQDGLLKSCILNQENRISTPVGELIPQYRIGEAGERQRKHRSSLSFHPNGLIKSAALDRPMPVRTPLEMVTAELVTFYDSGEMNRVFPLNGKVDAFWNELQERELAEPIEFSLKIGRFRAKVMCIHFYPSGALKSLTFWPDEKVLILTPHGPALCRAGLSLYENGNLKSYEPSRPVKIETAIGEIYAFDSEIIGIHGDQNSVQFDVNGKLRSLKTVHTGIGVERKGLPLEKIEPMELPSLIHEEEMRTVPLKLDFGENLLQVTVHSNQIHDFSLPNADLSTYRMIGEAKSGCSGCSGCSDNTAGCCLG